jgi:hypothetical protein
MFQRRVSQSERTRGSEAVEPSVDKASVQIWDHSKRRHRRRHEEQLPRDAQLHEGVSLFMRNM